MDAAEGQPHTAASISERPMRADARRNHERILAAARELFASDRPEVQVDDVARKAGVGVGTLYRHFPDKQALMGALVRERFEFFNASLSAALADERSEPFAALADTLRAQTSSLAEDAATRHAFVDGGERVWEHAAREVAEFERLSRLLVRRAHAAGSLRRDFTAADIPVVICGVCATIEMRKPGTSWRRHLELLIAGMGSANAERPLPSARAGARARH